MKAPLEGSWPRSGLRGGYFSRCSPFAATLRRLSCFYGFSPLCVLFCDQKSTRKVPLLPRRGARPRGLRGCEQGATVERSETGERAMFAPAGRITARAGMRSKLAAIVLAAKRSPLGTPKLWSKNPKAKKCRNDCIFLNAFGPFSILTPSGPKFLYTHTVGADARHRPANSTLHPLSPSIACQKTSVGGGVLDAPQVCVVTRLDINARFPSVRREGA